MKGQKVRGSGQQRAREIEDQKDTSNTEGPTGGS